MLRRNWLLKLDADFIDGFILNKDGKFWVTTNSGNTVVVAGTGSNSVVIAGAPRELIVAGDTALTLGRGPNIDKNIAYGNDSSGANSFRPADDGQKEDPRRAVPVLKLEKDSDRDLIDPIIGMIIPIATVNISISPTCDNAFGPSLEAHQHRRITIIAMDGTSQSTASMRSSPATDPLELLDLSDYDAMSYQSPALSPSAANKMHFARPTPTIVTTPATMPTNQILSGPSHQYDQYKQQTPFVPGALANTLAINESNAHINGYNLDYINPGEELFDFNATPHNMTTPDMDLDFESPAESAFYFPQGSNLNLPTGNPTSPAVPTQASTVGRMYPGMHQRAALAKAQAQQMQQQQEMIQRQQNQQRRQQQQNRPPRPKVAEPSDPIVEQKITQLLNSMRSKVNTTEPEDNTPLLQVTRAKKEEDEMDEDERLLASEAGKKLSSKERRQLRNKVSARAFRSRRKEYIGQLEQEIAAKVTENNDLRAENRALSDENKRLNELTRMLLASPQFSSFLDRLSSDPGALQAQPQMEQRQPQPAQVPKDTNPYNMMNMGQQQQIGMVMIPEQSMDFSMLNLNTDSFSYQPQVFTVLETPELPEINTDALAGKTSNFVGESVSDGDKTDAPLLEAPVPSMIEKSQVEVNAELAPTETEKIASNLDGDIFDDGYSLPSQLPLELDTDGFSPVDIFGGIDPEKAFARYELVDSSEEEKIASMAARRVERLAANLAATISRLELLDL
ncbi:hypothetical protein GQX73_g2130 [Xylaria multiplex]|uniref:BZIP domain-containing protein n=1 Tax=Xylaria multiplex TaxID=323545 RepID=A0A7C8IUL5_9PEZI|nr:hypothetical protein GQX73_g2130 [Xylaria multiplex]